MAGFLTHVAWVMLAVCGVTRGAPAAATAQWGRFEVQLQGPSTGNPFEDVSITGTFSHVGAKSLAGATHKPLAGGSTRFAGEDSHRPWDLQKTGSLPRPVLAFDFADVSASGRIANLGTSKAEYPTGYLTANGPVKSAMTPLGMKGASIDFGSAPPKNERRAVDIPEPGSSFDALAGAKSLSVTGWLNCRDATQGAGGNRVFNWCRNGDRSDCGVDLVWLNDGSLKFSVNQWPDVPPDHPRSGSGRVPCSSSTDDNWVFFAITYDAMLAADNVKFYFGTTADAAMQDTEAKNTSMQAQVASPKGLSAAFGGFSEFDGPDRMWRGLMYAPKVYASKEPGGEGALTAEQVVAVQARSNCTKNACDGRMCGAEVCAPQGTCGTCHPSLVCNPHGMCERPSTFKVRGFYDGEGVYKVRFMPPRIGDWNYTITSNVPSLNGRTGNLTVGPASPRVSGLVTARAHHFANGDGTPHFSTGTTCYAWAYQNASIQNQTLATLQSRGVAFNKLRMTTFPKYNHDDPAYYPYEGEPQTHWDFRRFNVTFWHRYEHLLDRLAHQGVQADLILFHPYDGGHWGFDCMGGRDPATYNTSNDEFYLQYVVARLGSFHNVWWAMANEWDFVGCKGKGIDQGQSPIWDTLFEKLSSEDVYAHETSIHNGAHLYNHSRPWITHVSLQGHEDDTSSIRDRFSPKPVVWDEVQYEGDIPSDWGRLSGEAMADRFWWGNSLGAYVGHGETILMANTSDDDQVLWWSKGNLLRGESPPRITWFREFMTNATKHPGFDRLVPRPAAFGSAMVDVETGYQLVYFQTTGDHAITLKANCTFDVVMVDYWNMERRPLNTGVSGVVTVSVSAVPYAVEMTPV